MAVVSWVVKPCCLVEGNQCFGRTLWLWPQGKRTTLPLQMTETIKKVSEWLFCPEDAVSRFLRNVGTCLPNNCGAAFHKTVIVRIRGIELHTNPQWDVTCRFRRQSAEPRTLSVLQLSSDAALSGTPYFHDIRGVYWGGGNIFCRHTNITMHLYSRNIQAHLWRLIHYHKKGVTTKVIYILQGGDVQMYLYSSDPY